MIYLQTSICVYAMFRMQQEPSTRGGNDKLFPPAFPSEDQPPTAKKKIVPFIDIWFPKLSPLVVEVRPRIQVELSITYQVPPPPRLVATS